MTRSGAGDPANNRITHNIQHNTLTCGSLFAGIGMFDLGFQNAGIKTVWQVEIDPACRSVLRRHFPEAEVYNDVKECGKHNLKPVDIICGGFPCQDLSVAGQRKGLVDGERSGLWFEFHRIITELEPRWVVIENVPGLLSSNEGRDFAILLGGLTGVIPEVPPEGWGNAGLARGWYYHAAYRVLDAQFFGVAQRRRRVFIVANLGGERAAQVLFESDCGGWDTAPSRETGQGTTGYAPSGFGDYRPGTETLRAEGGDCGNGSEVLAIDVRNNKMQDGGVSGTLQSKKTGGYSLNYQNPIAFSSCDDGSDATNDLSPTLRVGSGLDIPSGPAVAFGGNNTSGPIDIATACNAHGGTGRSDFESETFVAYNIQHNDGGEHKRKDRPNGGMYVNETNTALTVGSTDMTCVTFREQADALCATYGTKWNGNASAENGSLFANHGMGVRRLMPVECERLQGAPDGWTDGQSDSTRYRQLGNAVCRNVAKWVGIRLAAAERGEL